MMKRVDWHYCSLSLTGFYPPKYNRWYVLRRDRGSRGSAACHQYVQALEISSTPIAEIQIVGTAETQNIRYTLPQYSYIY
jgi:hypothetical protein